MLLKSKQNDGLVENSKFQELIDPFQHKVTGQLQGGQNEQQPELFNKKDLVFPSGENLPLCWIDSNYKSK